MITGFNTFSDANQLKKHQLLPKLKKIAVAPLNLRETFLKNISDEINCVKTHGSGLVMAKLNALVDKEIIDALYAASSAGVKIKLIVRGICCLVPGVTGMSENIEIISILDRFLEHSRAYYFQAAGKSKLKLML